MKICYELAEHYNIDNHTKGFLYIVMFHERGIINNERMKGMFKSLKANTFLTKKNTYHSKINNKWYNDESMLSILKDISEEKITPTLRDQFIEIESLIKYINIYYNRPRNWCIDWIFLQLVKPIISSYEYGGYNEYPYEFYLRFFGVEKNKLYIKEYADFEADGFGYCCEDCDGKWEDYVNNQWQYYGVTNNKKEIENYFVEYLNSIKIF